MLKNMVVGAAPFALWCSTITSLAGCSPITSSNPAPQGERGTGNYARLSASEWSAYLSDTAYIRNLTAPNVSVKLNHADPRQHNFAMTRLKLAGKNAENSPHLFELIEARRQAQVASGLKAGTFAQNFDDPPTAPVAMHFIQTSSIGGATANMSDRRTTAAVNAPLLAVGTAASTFPGGTDDTYVDITIATLAGTPIAPFNYNEQFENPDGNVGADVTVTTSGDTNLSNNKSYTFESYKYEDVPGQGFFDSYAHEEKGSQVPQPLSGLPQLSAPQIDQPVDTVGLNSATPDGKISVCMDRNWTNDCDYILDTGSVTMHRVKMPLKGFIKITTTTQHVFNRARIQQIRDTLNSGRTDPLQGTLKVILSVAGGGCDVDVNNALFAKMASFWNNTSLSADNQTFFWDLSGANAAFFDEGCTQIQNSAKLTLNVPLPISSIGGPDQYQGGLSVNNDVTDPAHQLPTITLTNSCLAAGTQIQLGSGRFAAIESLRIGQEIFSPYAGDHHALTITDTAKGSERSPMVRIRDEAGHTLLMTEMHPIATPDRGMVQARALRTGDVVMTRQGPRKLTEVSREPYGGQVYNLKVGSEPEMASLGPDQTAVYANGFLVGDGQIQSKYEELAQKQGARVGIDQVPEQWRRDYLLSPHHN